MKKAECCVLIPAYQPPESVLGYLDALREAGAEDVLVVDDGSGAAFDARFALLAEKPGCEVLRCEPNRGKGGALKAGYAHIRATRPECRVVVTADCDGQHTAEDVLRAAREASAHPGELVLGVRDFSRAADGSPVPLRSRFGNACSSVLFWLLYHYWLCDTQTGLRGFSASLLEWMERIPGQRYEYETRVLTTCRKEHIPLRTLPITTVYENNNETSHFNPLRDGTRIMAVMLREFVS